MASPTVQTTSTGANAAGTSHTITLPASIAAGDLIVVLFAPGSNSPGAITTTGYSNLTNDANGTGSNLIFAYKTAVGGETTATFSTANSVKSCYSCYRISGWSGTPEKGTAATATSTNPDPPNLAPSWGAADYLSLAAFAVNNISTASAAPTNYGNLKTSSTTASTGESMASAERQLTASSDNPGTFTNTSAVWVAQTYAIKGVAAAAAIASRARLIGGILTRPILVSGRLH